jgi:dihydroorotase
VSAEPERFDLLIRGAQLVLPDGIKAGAVAVSDGRIAALLEPGTPAAAERVVEADGLAALPGMFDMHVHFREPGQTHKETFETGTAAAAVGGFTGVAEMPNTVPPTTSAHRLLDKKALAAGRSHVDFALWGGAGSAQRVGELARAGAAGVKVYLGLETARDAHSDAPAELVVGDDAAFCDILEAAAEASVVVAVHCGNQALRSRSRQPWRGKGFAELKAEIASEPQLHKVEAVSRTLLLAEESGARVHIVHVPARALPHVRRAKERGVAVTAEAALPFVTHDLLDEIGELGFDRYHSVEDARQIWAAVRDGTVDVLATDHAPHTLREKRAGRVDLLASPSGYPELDTAVPMLLDAVNRGLLTLERLVAVMSFEPARILGLSQKGALRVGGDADLVIVDMKREAVIERSRLRSKAGWSPFEGRRLIGWPVRTFLRGQEIAAEGRLTDSHPNGLFLPGSAAGGA